MDLVQRKVGVLAAERDAGPLDREDGLVEVALRGGEFAGRGPGAGDVCDVGAVLAARVDEEHFVLGNRVVVDNVVDAEAVAPARDDGDVGRAVAAVGGEAVV